MFNWLVAIIFSPMILISSLAPLLSWISTPCKGTKGGGRKCLVKYSTKRSISVSSELDIASRKDEKCVCISSFLSGQVYKMIQRILEKEINHNKNIMNILPKNIIFSNQKCIVVNEYANYHSAHLKPSILGHFALEYNKV